MSERAPTRLIFVRHGESNVTVAQVLGGEKTCTGLSALGRRQAEALRDRLASERLRHDPAVRVDSIWSSQLPRASETADIVAPVFDLSVRIDPDLEELRPGEADGVPFAEYAARFGGDDPRSNPWHRIAPDGESVYEFHARAGSAIRRLVDDHIGQTLLVFCHGGIVDVALRSLLRLPIRAEFELSTFNTSMTEFVLVDPDVRRRWRLMRYNDHAHLFGLPAQTPRQPPSGQ